MLEDVRPQQSSPLPNPSPTPEDDTQHGTIKYLRSDVSFTNSQVSDTCDENCAGNGGVSIGGGDADGGSVVINGNGDTGVNGSGGSVIINNNGDDSSSANSVANSNGGNSTSIANSINGGAGTGDDTGDVGTTVHFTFSNSPTSSSRTSSSTQGEGNSILWHRYPE